MTHALLTPDPDPVDRARAVDLADAGLPGYCACVVIGADGEEHMMLAAYNLGVADGRVLNWQTVAPHEDIGRLPKPYERNAHA